MKNNRWLILFIFLTLAFLFLNKNSYSLEIDGTYYYGYDENIKLVIKNDTYTFYGSGEEYDHIIHIFNQKGKIVDQYKADETKITYYPLSKKTNPPYIAAIDDTSIRLHIAINIDYTFPFHKKHP